MNKKELNRKKRHRRIRKKISGTGELPRLSIRRTLAHLHAQLIDDLNGVTLVGMSTQDKNVQDIAQYGGSCKAAEALGNSFAARMKEKGLDQLCFDRGGYRYLGRVKVFADALRNNGIKF